MSILTGLLIVMGLFVLRFGVPLAVIGIIVYSLRRLEARWHPGT
jgi:hypothetical protein